MFVIGKDEDIPNCPKCKSPVSTKTSIDPRENVTPPKVSGDIGTPSRPRDSPNRYDFRKVPAIPLISEKADSEGKAQSIRVKTSSGNEPEVTFYL